MGLASSELANDRGATRPGAVKAGVISPMTTGDNAVLAPTDEKPQVETKLQSGALGLTEVLMQGISHTAPATAILLTLPFTARDAGVTAPLAYLVAFLIVLMLGIVLTQLARQLPSAGGYYTYVSHTIHPRAGFLAAWLYFLYTPMAPAFCLAMMGAILERFLKAEFGLVLPWWAFLILGTAFTFWLAYQGITVSAAALVVLGALEMAIVLLLAAWGLFFPGNGGVNLVSFNPANAPSGSGLYLAIIFSIFALTGWEGVVPLAEESRHPRRIMPQAILGVILIMGGYLVFAAWGILIGWGTSDIGSFINSADVPAFALAQRYWGWGRFIVVLALLNSMLGACLATTLVSTRMWYAMGRAGSLPSAMALVHPKHKTPITAIYFQTLVTLVVGLGLGFWIGPEQEFYFLGTVITLALVPIYSAGNLGAFLLYFRDHRKEFRPVLHALLPALATVAVVWVGYKSVVPLPPPPGAYAPWIVISWFAIGVLVLGVVKMTGRESRLTPASGTSNQAADVAMLDQIGDREPR